MNTMAVEDGVIRGDPKNACYWDLYLEEVEDYRILESDMVLEKGCPSICCHCASPWVTLGCALQLATIEKNPGDKTLDQLYN